MCVIKLLPLRYAKKRYIVAWTLILEITPVWTINPDRLILTVRGKGF